MAISPRQNAEQVTHVIRYDFSYVAPGNGTLGFTGNTTGGVQIGALPPGAIPITTIVAVTDAFNSATSAAINVGFSGNATDLISAGNLASAATTSTAVPNAAQKTAKNATAKTGTPVYATLASAGTYATTGNATIIVTYHPDYSGGAPWGVAGA